jgi:hypothetical protein
MLRRRQMAHEEDVGSPWKIRGIERAADDEAPLRHPARRLDQQRRQRLLAVLRVSAEIGQISAKTLDRFDRGMNIGIDAAVQRRHPVRAQTGTQRIERRTPGIAQHQIEIPKTTRPDIAGRLAGLQPGQGDRRIQVIETLDRHPRSQHQIRSLDTVRAIGGDHADIGIGEMAVGQRNRIRPVPVQHQFPARYVEQVAMAGVIGHIPFEEHDMVTAADQRPAQAAPQRAVSVAPGRTDGKAENDEFHIRPLIREAFRSG